MKQQEEFLEKDFAGRKLCKSCWDGNHYFKWAKAIDVGKKGQMMKIVMKSGKGAEVFSNCAEGGCECQCRNLRAERNPHLRRDHNGQMSIEEVVGTIKL